MRCRTVIRIPVCFSNSYALCDFTVDTPKDCRLWNRSGEALQQSQAASMLVFFRFYGCPVPGQSIPSGGPVVVSRTNPAADGSGSCCRLRSDNKRVDDCLLEAGARPLLNTFRNALPKNSTCSALLKKPVKTRIA